MANEFVIKNGYFSQGNSNVTGSLQVTGSVGVTGSVSITENVTASKALFSSSGTNQLMVMGSGSDSWVTGIYGSQGNLLTVTDTFSGSIFTVSDISGYPILDITSDYYTGSVYLPTLQSQSQQYVVAYNSQSGLLSYMSASAGGGGTPGGQDTQIQFNSGSTFSGSSNFTFDYNTNSVTLNGSFSTSNTHPSLLVTESNNKPTVKLGDYSTAGNGTKIEIDDDSATLGLSSNGNLNINSAYINLTPSTALKIDTLIESPQDKVLVWDSASKQVYYTASNALGGGSGTPGGSNKQVQFNANGISFSGSSNFTFNSASNLVEITGSLTVSGSGTFTNIGPAIFSGSVTSTQGFTGSLLGTASWANNALTASTIILNPVLPTTLYIVGSDTTGGGEKILTNNAFSYTTTTKLISATASWAESASQASTASFWSGYSSTSSIIGNGAASSFNINHGFNTRNLHITVYENGSNGETVYPDIRRINANTASIIFANPPTSLQYVVYISQ